MVKFEGTLQFKSKVRTAGNKQVMDTAILQQEKGFRPEIMNCTVWSDSDAFTALLNIEIGHEVQCKANPTLERNRDKVLTGNLKYSLLEIMEM